MTHSFQVFDQLARQSQAALYLYIDIETVPSQDPTVTDAIRAKHVVAPLDLSVIVPDARLKTPEQVQDEIAVVQADILDGDLDKTALKAAKKRLTLLEKDLPLAAQKIEADLAKRRANAIEGRAAAILKAEAAIEEEWRKTALDASTGQIVSASVALGDQVVASVPVDDLSVDAEHDMLIDLFEGIESMLDQHARALALEALVAAGRSDIESVKLEVQRQRVVPVVVAHHAAFDIRYVWQRAMILGVTPPSWWPIDARPWDTDRLNDTMLMWAGHGNRIGLDRLCRALGLPGKTGVDGSMVWDLVRDGRIDEVVSYCDDDVRRLRSVHRRMIGLPVLDVDAIEVLAVGAEGEKEAA